MTCRNKPYELLPCGKHKPLPFGSYAIQSPNYGDTPAKPATDYPTTSSAEYELTAADPQGGLDFQCHQFLIEHTKPCTADYLEVDGTKYCGDDRPPQVNTAQMNIRFRTDAQNTNMGYFCTVLSKEYGAGCEGLPWRDSPPRARCPPHLQPELPRQLQRPPVLQMGAASLPRLRHSGDPVSQFDIESYDHSCLWDYLKVENTRYCTRKPVNTVSTLYQLTVEYTTAICPTRHAPAFIVSSP